MFGRRKLAALVAEFLGTGVLTTTVLSIQHSGVGFPLFVGASAGLAMMLFWFAVGDFSGGHFNPAITIGQWTAGKVSTLTTIMYVIVQLLGGWAAYGVYIYLVNTHLSPVGGHYSARILLTEGIGTAVFAFAFAAAIYKGMSQAVTASFVGLGLMVGVIIAFTFSQTNAAGALGLLNPAVALGLRSWVWGTYVLGPVLGAIVGTQLYRLFFVESEAFIPNFSMSMASLTVSEEVVSKPAAKPKTAKKSSAKKSK